MALGAENERQHNYDTQQHQQRQNQNQMTLVPHIKSSPGVRHVSLGINACNIIGSSCGDGVNPTSVVRRNARERNRVKQVNNGFTILRQHIPAAVVADLSNGRRGIGPGADKKLSKVNTLRMAVEYIRRLQILLDENSGAKVKSSTTLHATKSDSNSFYKHSNAPQKHSTQNQKFYYGITSCQSHPKQKDFCDSTNSNSSTLSLSSSSNVLLPFASPPMDFEQQCHLLQQQQNHHHNNQSDLSHQPQSTYFNTLKLEHPENVYEGHQNTSCSSSGAEDDEILDYISLWQDDL